MTIFALAIRSGMAYLALSKVDRPGSQYDEKLLPNSDLEFVIFEAEERKFAIWNGRFQIFRRIGGASMS